MTEKVNLTESLKELEAIAQWFDEQQEVDVEEGLTKVKEAAKLIKSSKARLAVIENEFELIEKEIADDSDAMSDSVLQPVTRQQDPVLIEEIGSDSSINLDDIPF